MHPTVFCGMPYYNNIWGCVYSTGPFHYRWLKGCIYISCYYHQIGSIHDSHRYHIFPWLCAWDVCYIVFCHLLPIHCGKTGNLLSLLLHSLWWVQIVGHIWLADRICLFVNYTISLSSLYKLIWRHWTYKSACQIYFIECVSKIKDVFSVIHYTMYGAVCFQFTHFPCDDWKHTYTSSYYHHQMGSMNYYPLIMVRSWNNGMRCMMTSSNGTFSVLLAISAGNSPVTGEFPAQRPVTRSFDVFFDLRLNKLLSKQSWGWWFETLLRPLWRQCNGMSFYVLMTIFCSCTSRHRRPWWCGTVLLELFRGH